MIEIRIFRDAQGAVVGFRVSGHARAAAHGKDIVCAAVSALTQTCLLGVGEYLGRDVDYHVASGNLSVELKQEPDALTSAIFETMILGLTEIEKIHPKNVRIL